MAELDFPPGGPELTRVRINQIQQPGANLSSDQSNSANMAAPIRTFAGVGKGFFSKLSDKQWMSFPRSGCLRELHVYRMNKATRMCSKTNKTCVWSQINGTWKSPSNTCSKCQNLRSVPLMSVALDRQLNTDTSIMKQTLVTCKHYNGTLPTYPSETSVSLSKPVLCSGHFKQDCWLQSSQNMLNVIPNTHAGLLNRKPLHRLISTRQLHSSLYVYGKDPAGDGKVSYTGDEGDKRMRKKQTPEQRKEQIKLAKEKVKEQLGELKEGMFTIPNVLTLSRIIAAPILGYLVLDESYSLACGVFVIAGITDLLDGWVARNFANQTSAMGSFLDPLADKLLVSILFITLSAVHLLPVPLTALIITRDVGLIIAAFYVRYISLPPPVTLVRFFDITHASAQLKPLYFSKVNTAVQLCLVAATLGAPVFGFVDHIALQTLWYVTAATTVLSGVGYMFAKDTFKILRKRSKQDEK